VTGGAGNGEGSGGLGGFGGVGAGSGNGGPGNGDGSGGNGGSGMGFGSGTDELGKSIIISSFLRASAGEYASVSFILVKIIIQEWHGKPLLRQMRSIFVRNAPKIPYH
jgi:hypothetical protein